MLGRASAAMTLDQYGHLLGDRLDEGAAAMDAAGAPAAAHPLPKAQVVDLEAMRAKATGQ